MDGQDRLMRVEEVTERLGLSKAAVYELVAAGRIASVRPSLDGRSVRVRESDLDQYIESLTRRAAVSATG